MLTVYIVGSGSVLIPDYRDHPLLGDPIIDDPIRSGPLFEASWTHALHCVRESLSSCHNPFVINLYLIDFQISYITPLIVITNSSCMVPATMITPITQLTVSSIYETTYFVTLIWLWKDRCQLQTTKIRANHMFAEIGRRPLLGLRLGGQMMHKTLLGHREHSLDF